MELVPGRWLPSLLLELILLHHLQKSQDTFNENPGKMERFETFTELEDALDRNLDDFVNVLKICWTNEGVHATGRKFLGSYLKSVIDPSLLYRMHPCSSRNSTPFYYKYGQQYFRFPKKLMDLISDYCREMFPSLWPTRAAFTTSFDCLLSNYRKIRAMQMRAYISEKALGQESHPLYFALAWDTWNSLGVFQSPAPIWSHHTSTDRDAFFAAHLEKWNIVTEAEGLQDWANHLPDRWAPGQDRFGPPSPAKNESYWPYP